MWLCLTSSTSSHGWFPWVFGPPGRGFRGCGESPAVSSSAAAVPGLAGEQSSREVTESPSFLLHSLTVRLNKETSHRLSYLSQFLNLGLNIYFFFLLQQTWKWSHNAVVPEEILL